MFKRLIYLSLFFILMFIGTSYIAVAEEKTNCLDIPKYHEWTFTLPDSVDSLSDITVELQDSKGNIISPSRRLNSTHKILSVYAPNRGYNKDLVYKLRILLNTPTGSEELFLRNFTIEGYVPKNLLLDLIHSNQNLFPEILFDDPSKFGIQVLYTEVSRDLSGVPSFKSYEYNVNSNVYFYPASSIKLSTCVLALDKLNSLNIPGVDKNTPMTTVSSSDKTLLKSSTISKYINSILLYSSNTAFNRLFDFLGYQYYNYTLENHNFKNTNIQHKLLMDDFDSGARKFNPIYFYDNYDHSKYTSISDRYNYKFNNSGMINLSIADKDFKYKNSSSIYDLQNMMKVIFFNDYLDENTKFDLTDSDLDLLKNSLKDTSHKYLIAGGNISDLPKGIEMYNKYGQAYGHFIDNAYIKDTQTNKEFLLTAVIYANSNDIMDGSYEYSSISLPFLKNLGKVLLEYLRR